MSALPTCKTCAWWSPEIEDSDQGTCRFHAPVPISTEEPGIPVAWWPITEEHEWCAEHHQAVKRVSAAAKQEPTP